MKHLLIFISFLLLVSKGSYSQVHNIHPVSYIFNPNSDASQDIMNATAKAMAEHKHVCMLIGGDWSYWSRLFYNTLSGGKDGKYVEEKYVIVVVNFSPANKNARLIDSLGCPKDQGYPIIMILDEKGKKLHMQNTDEYKLWQKWYDEEAILNMLKKWS